MKCVSKKRFKVQLKQSISFSDDNEEAVEVKSSAEKPGRPPRALKIRRLQESNNNLPTIEESISQSQQRIELNLSTFVRFGPLYDTDIPFDQSASKKQAWKHLLGTISTEKESEIISTYIAAVRSVQEEAHEAYDDNLVEVKRSDFRWVMVQDGCFFLQLALCILGGREPLGYPRNHVIFGTRELKNQIKFWSRSMFFVGNQIPVVVLHELMKQSFFQNVLKNGTWDPPPPPSSWSKRVLYEQLVLPSLGPKMSRFNSLFRGLPFCGKRNMPSARRIVTDAHHRPCDVIQAIRNLVLGPEPERDELDDDDDFDLEANGWNTSSAVDDQRRILKATKLRQKGIKIKQIISKDGRNVGSRGIYFKESFFGACLHLPPIKVTVDTEIILQALKSYEMDQPSIDKRQREVCSYIRFMSEIIRTPKDVQLLAKEGVILGTQQNRDKLPGILRRLECEDVTKHLYFVKLQISDYSGPEWQGRLKKLLSMVVFLTLVQTVYAMLNYHRPTSKYGN